MIVWWAKSVARKGRALEDGEETKPAIKCFGCERFGGLAGQAAVFCEACKREDGRPYAQQPAVKCGEKCPHFESFLSQRVAA